MAICQSDAGEPGSANLTGRYVPREVSHIKDYLRWMVLSYPEFDSKGGHSGQTATEGAFEILNCGLKAVEKRIGTALLSQLIEMSGAARLAFNSGDEKRGFEILNDMHEMRWTGRKKTSPIMKPMEYSSK